MQTSLPLELARSERRKPVWEMALAYPDQGGWSEEDYLDLDIGRQVEFTNGTLEFLPMPPKTHQRIVLFLVNALNAFAASKKLGQAVQAPFPVKIKGGKYREPDVAFLLAKHAAWDAERFWAGADLVIEVLSASNPSRDRQRKRREYAEAGIPEYWIVDPEGGAITVLCLKKGAYVVHGEYETGQQASSVLLPGFKVDVKDAL